MELLDSAESSLSYFYFHDQTKVFCRWKSLAFRFSTTTKKSPRSSSVNEPFVRIRCTEDGSVFDRDFQKCCWAHAEIPITKSCLDSPQHRLRAWRSQASHIDFQPCHMRTEISPDSCFDDIMDSTMHDEIRLCDFLPDINLWSSFTVFRFFFRLPLRVAVFMTPHATDQLMIKLITSKTLLPVSQLFLEKCCFLQISVIFCPQHPDLFSRCFHGGYVTYAWTAHPRQQLTCCRLWTLFFHQSITSDNPLLSLPRLCAVCTHFLSSAADRSSTVHEKTSSVIIHQVLAQCNTVLQRKAAMAAIWLVQEKTE